LVAPTSNFHFGRGRGGRSGSVAAGRAGIFIAVFAPITGITRYAYGGGRRASGGAAAEEKEEEEEEEVV
jgi:hypothetical protein